MKSPVKLTQDQAVGMKRSVHRCLIHQTLLSVPEIEITVRDGISDWNGTAGEPVDSVLGRAS